MVGLGLAGTNLVEQCCDVMVMQCMACRVLSCWPRMQAAG